MFKFLKKKKEPKNLKEILSQFNDIKGSFSRISKKLKDLENKNKFSIQGIGVVRFNPFKESGGDQSFSIALLDGNKDGVVISSLYGREGNRVFAKPIKNGRSEYLLTEEEKRAIEQAKKNGKNK
ncbi:MAG: DUF4446 family protein [Candidatus Nealsonbacteria bacterium]|nr:MAG: DUF4446 family protein [Candidatus Nealsonbacteria bacterium]